MNRIRLSNGNRNKVNRVLNFVPTFKFSIHGTVMDRSNRCYAVLDRNGNTIYQYAERRKYHES